MDGVSLSYTCMASAISGGLRVHAGTWLGSLLAIAQQLIKINNCAWSSAYRKALTGKKRAGRVGPWASRFPEVNTPIHLNF